MKVELGSKAIDFNMKDIYGNTVRLSDYRGKKIILSFYRNVNCPFCNRQVHKVMSLGNRLKKQGVQLLFFFESSNEKLRSSTFHQGISPWPLIGDSEREVYNKYGVEQSTLKMMKTMFLANVNKAKKETAAYNLPEDKDASLNLIPADFFIDEAFTVVRAHYGSHIDDHVDIDDMREFAGIANPFKNVS